MDKFSIKEFSKKEPEEMIKIMIEETSYQETINIILLTYKDFKKNKN